VVPVIGGAPPGAILVLRGPLQTLAPEDHRCGPEHFRQGKSSRGDYRWGRQVPRDKWVAVEDDQPSAEEFGETCIR